MLGKTTGRRVLNRVRRALSLAYARASISLFELTPLFLLVALCLGGNAPAAAASLNGTAINGTTGQPAGGDEVGLKSLAGGMAPIGRAKTDGHGAFKFRVTPKQAPYLVSVIHQGVSYQALAPSAAMPVEVRVYDVAAKLDGVTATQEVERMQTDGDRLEVIDEVAVVNSSNPPRTLAKDRALEIQLPPEAEVVGGKVIQAGWNPVTSKPVAGEKGRYYFRFPLGPGETRFVVAYQLAYRGEATIDPKILYPLEQLVIVVPETMRFEAKSRGLFQPVAGRPGTYLQQMAAAKPGTSLAFRISGSGQLQPPTRYHWAPGAMARRQPAPAAPAPPARLLDRDRWLLMGGFALLVAAAALFLHKRRHLTLGSRVLNRLGVRIARLCSRLRKPLQISAAVAEPRPSGSDFWAKQSKSPKPLSTLGLPGVALLALYLAVAAPAKGASVHGAARNLTTSQPAGGDDVLLMSASEPSLELARGKTGANGQFRFDAGGIQASFVLCVIHQGVGYCNSAPRGNAPIDVQVYDGAKEVSGMSLAWDVQRFETEGDSLRVQELILLRNASNPPRTLMNERPFEIQLPPEAQVDSAMVRSEGGRTLGTRPVVSTRKGRYYFPYPLRPGETRFAVVYHLPYRGEATLQPEALYPVEQFGVVAPKSMTFQVKSNALFRLIQDNPQTFAQATLGLKAGDRLAFRISGKGSLSKTEEPQVPLRSGTAPYRGPAPTNGPGPARENRWLVLAGAAAALAALAAGLITHVRKRRTPAAATQPDAV